MCGFDHSAIDKHRAARECESINVGCVDDTEVVTELRMSELWRNGRGECLSHALDIRIRVSVFRQQRHFLSDLCGRLLSELDVVLSTVLVFRGRYLCALTHDKGSRHHYRNQR